MYRVIIINNCFKYFIYFIYKVVTLCFILIIRLNFD